MSDIFLKHFKLSEFECPCCGRAPMDETFLRRLDSARSYAGVPFIPASGYRCKRKNDSLKNASPNSSHLRGCAADIECRTDADRWAVLFGVIAAGFRRIGVYSHHIHVDMDRSKCHGRVWIGRY